MTDEIAVQTPASLDDKEKTIQKLTQEKKALEEKNKRLALILEITAKNAEKLKAGETPGTEPEKSTGQDMAAQITSIKKEIGTLERKIEKSKALQSSEQLNTVVAEIKSGFSKVEERMNALDKLTAFEKKLIDIEDSITLRKKSSSNLFGGLGTIGGDDSDDAQKKPENGEDGSDSSDDFSKLDEINLKIDALSKKIEDLHAGGGKHFFSDSLKKMMPFSEKDRKDTNEELLQIQQSVSEEKAPKEKEDSEIAFKKNGSAGARAEDPNSSALDGAEKNIISEDIKFKVHTPSHFMDFKKIPEDIRNGHVVLLNVKELKEESIDDLKHFIGRVKGVADSISSRIVGIGEHHIIVLPKKMDMQNDSNKS